MSAPLLFLTSNKEVDLLSVKYGGTHSNSLGINFKTNRIQCLTSEIVLLQLID
jgi:hypothetical protein